jgi:hypothetical protein
MRKIGGIILFIYFPLVLMGQRKNTVIQAPQSPKTAQSSNWSLGISTSTNSGIFGGIQFRKPFGLKENRNFIQLEAALVKDYREFNSPYTFNGRSHVDGKLNQLIVLRPAYGRQWTLLQKSTEGGQKLMGLISTGPSIGVQKPYYVEISYDKDGIQAVTEVPYSKTLDNSFKKVTIMGESSLFKGLNESIIIPGWHVKTAVNMEIETLKQNNIGIEIGFVIDFFSKPIEMLNLTAGRQVYTTGYISFSMGKQTK